MLPFPLPPLLATGGWGAGVLLLKFGVLFDEPLPPQAANPNRAVQKTVTVFKAVFFIILIPFFERLPLPPSGTRQMENRQIPMCVL